nr:MAG TPA: hypothetical protein [Caudoviricetes sp.]
MIEDITHRYYSFHFLPLFLFSLTAAQSVSPFLVGDYMNLKDTTLYVLTV